MNNTDLPENHGTAWSFEEEQRLDKAFRGGMNVADLAKAHQRRAGGISSHLKQLGLLDEEGNVVPNPPEFTPTKAAIKRRDKATAKQSKREAAAKTAPPIKPIEINDSIYTALSLMEDTAENLFLTGKAGTGKSTLLDYFCRTTTKQPVILASTGVAALNVKGQTIHSFFGFYVDVTPDKISKLKKPPRNSKLLKKLKMIIIDEASMVRADLMDCVATFLKKFGPHVGKPFGGVQIVLVGDLYQLPPVVTRDDQVLFDGAYYDTPYFFSAHAFRDAPLTIVELEKVYRQRDQTFIDLLNRIRNNSATHDDIDHINSRVMTESGASMDTDCAITLSTTNAIADMINEKHLAALKGKLMQAEARMTGSFPRENYPTAPSLAYKIGAQIMMLNNDAERRWVNGSIGVIRDQCEDDAGDMYLEVQLQGRSGTIEVYPYSWEVYRFGLEGSSIVSESIGSFSQYPFRLAWAITIHKSQGKTFDRVTIALGRGAFAAGQMYVALSRCTSFEGVTLLTPARANDIRTDDRIIQFLNSKTAISPAKSANDIMKLIEQAIRDRAGLMITYMKADDTQTACAVIPLAVGMATYMGEKYQGMKASSIQHDNERMFRVDRILDIARIEIVRHPELEQKSR